MGVDDINKTLITVKDVITNSLKTVGVDVGELIFKTGIPLTFFAGKKVAFDISMVMNAKMITAHKEFTDENKDITEEYDRSLMVDRAIKAVLGFFGTVLKSDITPICVFEGKTHPYKQAEVDRRCADKKFKIDDLNQATNEFLEMSPLDRTQEMEAELRKKQKKCIRIRSDDYVKLKTALTGLGISCLDAKFDGEKLCASLSREGLVSAVYGNDTDNYPLGTSILITKIYWNGKENVCDIVNLAEILFCLENYCGRPFGLDELIDLCIIHGCDFNQRMLIPKKKFKSGENPYKSCGPSTGLDMIKQYGKFENFPPNVFPFLAPLKIAECRYMYSYEPSEQTEETVALDWGEYCKNSSNIISKYNLDGYTRVYFNSVNSRNLCIKKYCSSNQPTSIQLSSNNIQNKNSSYCGYVL